MREKKEINVQIGEQVKQAREAARMTQEQLAECIDVSPQYISDLERGVVGISIPTLKRLCEKLSVSSDRILFGCTQEHDFTPVAARCNLLSKHQFTLLVEIVDRFIQAVTANE